MLSPLGGFEIGFLRGGDGDSPIIPQLFPIGSPIFPFGILRVPQLPPTRETPSVGSGAMSGDGMFLPWEGSNLPTGAIGESSSWFSSSGIGLDPSDDFYSLPETHIFAPVKMMVGIRSFPVWDGLFSGDMLVFR